MGLASSTQENPRPQLVRHSHKNSFTNTLIYSYVHTRSPSFSHIHDLSKAFSYVFFPPPHFPYSLLYSHLTLAHTLHWTLSYTFCGLFLTYTSSCVHCLLRPQFHILPHTFFTLTHYHAQITLSYILLYTQLSCTLRDNLTFLYFFTLSHTLTLYILQSYFLSFK